MTVPSVISEACRDRPIDMSAAEHVSGNHGEYSIMDEGMAARKTETWEAMNTPWFPHPRHVLGFRWPRSQHPITTSITQELLQKSVWFDISNPLTIVKDIFFPPCQNLHNERQIY